MTGANSAPVGCLQHQRRAGWFLLRSVKMWWDMNKLSFAELLLHLIPCSCKMQRTAANLMPSMHVWANNQACRVYLKPCSVYVSWETLLPSDRHNQSFVWINLTDKGAVEAETSFFNVHIQQKVFRKLNSLMTQLKRWLAYLVLWEERRTKIIKMVFKLFRQIKKVKRIAAITLGGKFTYKRTSYLPINCICAVILVIIRPDTSRLPEPKQQVDKHEPQ